MIEYKRLDEIFDLQMGKTPDRHNPDYWKNGTEPWISIADIGKCEKYIEQTAECINELAVKETGIKIIPENTVIMSFKLSIGKVAITPKPMYSNEAIMAFIDKGVLDISPRYLYFLLMQKDWDEGTNKAVLGKTLNKATLSDIKIPIHSAAEQAHIVQTLESAEKIISLRRAQLNELDRLIKARFVEMFGLPVSNSMNWPIELMCEVAPVVNFNGAFNDKVWLLNLDAVESQTGHILFYHTVPRTDVGNSTCTFDTSNVLYSKLRPYLNKVVIPDRIGYATSELLPLKPNRDKINREYLAFMLRSDEFVKMINEKVAGAKMPRVSMSDFRSFNVPIPPLELQNQFSDFVSQVEKSKAAIQKALDQAQMLFDSLMQAYFG